jgi:uncharacterized repeat protein (TIGR01451 family)
VIENCADAYSDTDDPDVGNNESCTSTVVGNVAPPTANVEVGKKGPATAHAGETITYELTVTNHGPGDAYDLIVSDPLDATYLTTVALPDDCTVRDGTVNCTAGRLTGGETRTFRITVKVNPHAAAGSWIENCDEVRSARTLLREVPGTACVQTEVRPHAPGKPAKPAPGPSPSSPAPARPAPAPSTTVSPLPLVPVTG